MNILLLAILARRILPSTSTGAFWRALIACLLGTSLLYALAPLTGMSHSFPVFGQDGYVELARSLVQGNGFAFEPSGPPTHHRPPLYPLVLTPIATLPDFLLLPAIILLHSLMLGCVGALIFTIARESFNLSIARGAVAIFLANPWLYANVKNPLTPVLQCLLYTTFIYVLRKEVVPLPIDHISPPSRRHFPPWLIIGSIGGLLSLTHGTLIAVNGASIALLVVLSLRTRNVRLVRTMALAGLVSMIIVAPWTYRNWAAFDRFIPVVGGAGVMYLYQYQHWSQEDPWPRPLDNTATTPTAARSEFADPSVWKFRGVTSRRLDSVANTEASRLVRTRPDVLVKGLALNAIAYYFPSAAEIIRAGGFNFGSSEQLYRPRVLGQWFDGIRFYAAASSPTRSRRT